MMIEKKGIKLMKKVGLLLIGFLMGCTASIIAKDYWKTSNDELTVADAYAVVNGKDACRAYALTSYLDGMRMFAYAYSVIHGNKPAIEKCIDRPLIVYENNIFKKYEAGDSDGKKLFYLEMVSQLNDCFKKK